jgi:hypothetical protein
MHMCRCALIAKKVLAIDVYIPIENQYKFNVVQFMFMYVWLDPYILGVIQFLE